MSGLSTNGNDAAIQFLTSKTSFYGTNPELALMPILDFSTHEACQTYHTQHFFFKTKYTAYFRKHSAK